MKLKIRTNFDFSKLSNKLDKILDNYISDYTQDSVEGSKANIDSGLKDIKLITKEIRKKRNQPQSPPLKASGELYKSIKKVGKSLDIVNYGILHHDIEIVEDLMDKYEPDKKVSKNLKGWKRN